MKTILLLLALFVLYAYLKPKSNDEVKEEVEQTIQETSQEETTEVLNFEQIHYNLHQSGSTDKELVVLFYNWMRENLSYKDFSGVYPNDLIMDSIIVDSLNCVLTAILFYNFCKESNIECYMVSNIKHMWNIYNYNGTYYQIDVSQEMLNVVIMDEYHFTTDLRYSYYNPDFMDIQDTSILNKLNALFNIEEKDMGENTQFLEEESSISEDDLREIVKNVKSGVITKESATNLVSECYDCSERKIEKYLEKIEEL